MGCLYPTCVFICLSTTTFLIIVTMNRYFALPPPPVMNEHVWWGTGGPTESDAEIKPFKIDVPQEVIDDLHNRLRRTLDFQPPLEGIQQQYGMNTNHLRNIIDFWLNKYDWREREEQLNKYPQFTVRIQGLNIHYLHVKPNTTLTRNLKVLPLLILHGWPSSIKEFYDLIPWLITPMVGRDFVFEIIAPSLPGFAFSEATNKPGLGSNEMAVILKNLMERLGFPKYYVQGTDWGGNIAQIMTTLYQDRLLGMHSNFCLVNTKYAYFKIFWGAYFPGLTLTRADNKARIYPLTEKFFKMLSELGYMHIQATYPDTLGVALRDSPAGLAAYMLEKYSLWTDSSFQNLEDGGLTKKFNLEDLLDNVMIYWITGCMTTSMRIYAETFTWKYFEMQVASLPTSVPSACARFDKDLIYQPKSVLQDKFLRLFRLSDLRGGHFPAMEVPDVLAGDIIEFVTTVEEYREIIAEREREKEEQSRGEGSRERKRKEQRDRRVEF